MAKLDNASFMVCCANGAGSSLMMKMTLEKVLKKLNIKPGKVHHCARPRASPPRLSSTWCSAPGTLRICSRMPKRRAPMSWD